MAISSVDIDTYKLSSAPVFKACKKKNKGSSRAGISGCERKDEERRIVGNRAANTVNEVSPGFKAPQNYQSAYEARSVTVVT